MASEGIGAGQALPFLRPMLVPLLPGTWTPDSLPFPFSSDLGFPRSRERMV